ncbi:sugar phosphate isomerase/epimerase family protein [Thermovenabulum sp.]|uniref:sugar phosphate isomerase/epimerase family protein n=1 Tax=Thermovenabulum sp. TaxID=3100335 RepID=UPI003C7B0A22
MQKRKLSVGIWSFGKGTDRYVSEGYKQYLNFYERIEIISNLSEISAVELTFPQDINEENAREVLDYLNKKKLAISALGVELVCDKEWKNGSFSSQNYDRRQKSIQLTKRAMDLAEKIGVEVVNLWLGQDGFDYVFQCKYNTAFSYLVYGLKECAQHNKNIKLSLEYKKSEPKMNCLVNSGGKALALSLLTGCENVGVTLDVGHAFNCGENPAEIASILMEYGKLFHIHLNDNYSVTDDDMPLGTVHIPQYIEFFYWLEKMGYKGWYSLDLYPYRDDPYSACEVSVDFIDKTIRIAEKLYKENIFDFNENKPPSQIIKTLLKNIFS